MVGGGHTEKDQPRAMPSAGPDELRRPVENGFEQRIVCCLLIEARPRRGERSSCEVTAGRPRRGLAADVGAGQP